MARERLEALGLPGLPIRAAGELLLAVCLLVALSPATGMALAGDPEVVDPEDTITDETTEVKSATVEAPEVELPDAPGVFDVFPVQGNYSYVDTFGAPRPGGRTHAGIDVMADRMTPVVAVAPGEVIAAKASDGISGTFVKIKHDDGAISSYLHLNNDTPGTDDGQGTGIAEGIEVGVRVEAGTLIGYVGDSGNAEDTTPHLHFAYSPDGSTAINPYPELQMAEGLLVAADTTVETLPFTGMDADILFVLATMLVMAGAGAVWLAFSYPPRARASALRCS